MDAIYIAHPICQSQNRVNSHCFCGQFEAAKENEVEGKGIFLNMNLIVIKIATCVFCFI